MDQATVYIIYLLCQWLHALMFGTALVFGMVSALVCVHVGDPGDDLGVQSCVYLQILQTL